jgi:acetylornithine deacetylase
VREPFEIAENEEIVTTVADAAAAVAGARPRITGASYWADSAFIAAAGVPTVVYGPGGAGAHELVEWASLGETATAARTLARVAARICT